MPTKSSLTYKFFYSKYNISYNIMLACSPNCQAEVKPSSFNTSTTLPLKTWFT